MKPNRRTGFQNMGSMRQFDTKRTSFQEPIDYAHEHAYDGLLILTDGYAPKPVIPDGFKTSLLWVCENENCYTSHKKWMEESGRVCIMQI